MMGAVRSVRARLNAGEQLTGTFVQIADPAACEFVGWLGFDLLCLEGEHSAFGPMTIQRLVAAGEQTPAGVIVRPAGNDPIAIATALDAGSQGVLVPRVNTAAEARAAVAAARFPPVGVRGLGPSRATGYGADIAGYLRRANDELLLAVQIETREALNHLDELLAVAHVDLVFVGPGDLACSLGIDDPGSVQLREAIESVFVRARQAERLTGIFAADLTDAGRWRAAGVSLVILGSDLGWLAVGARAALSELSRE